MRVQADGIGRGVPDGMSVVALLPPGKEMGVLSQLELCRRVSSMLTWPLTDPARGHSWTSVLEPGKLSSLTALVTGLREIPEQCS